MALTINPNFLPRQGNLQDKTLLVITVAASFAGSKVSALFPGVYHGDVSLIGGILSWMLISIFLTIPVFVVATFFKNIKITQFVAICSISYAFFKTIQPTFLPQAVLSISEKLAAIILIVLLAISAIKYLDSKNWKKTLNLIFVGYFFFIYLIFY